MRAGCVFARIAAGEASICHAGQGRPLAAIGVAGRFDGARRPVIVSSDACSGSPQARRSPSRLTEIVDVGGRLDAAPCAGTPRIDSRSGRAAGRPRVQVLRRSAATRVGRIRAGSSRTAHGRRDGSRHAPGFCGQMTPVRTSSRSVRRCCRVRRRSLLGARPPATSRMRGRDVRPRRHQRAEGRCRVEHQQLGRAPAARTVADAPRALAAPPSRRRTARRPARRAGRAAARSPPGRRR